MSTIHSENFDGSSSLPSGWSASGTWAIKGSPYPTGVSPTSTPNMLQGSASSGAIWFTYGTADGVSGNLTVQVNAITSSMGTPGIVGVSARGSAAALTSATTQYTGWFDTSTGQVGLSKWSGGVKTDLATMTPVAAPTGWGQLSVALNGTGLSLSIKDLGNGNWLNAAGGWQSSQATALSATDASISGSGYYGVFASPSYGSFAPYFDDFAASSSAVVSGTAGTIGATEGRDTPSLAGGFRSAGSIAKAEGADLPSMAAVQSAGSIAKAEGRDLPAIVGVSTVGVMAASGRPDTAAMTGGSNHGILSTQEGRDSPVLSGRFGSPAAMAPTEARDIPSLVAFANAGAMAAVERPDTPSLAATFAARATLAAVERADIPAIVGVATGRAVLACIEAGDRPAILATAAGVPPYFKVQERPDVPSFAGVCATLHYNVYADTGVGDPIDYGTAVGVSATTTWASAGRLAPGTWSFGVRAANGWGEEQNLDVAVTFVIDANGTDITNIPAAPIALAAVPIGGGSIRVEWAYPPTRTAAPYPSGFHVYQGTGGAPSYATPVATVTASWIGTLAHYSAEIGGLADGTRYWFGVRAFNRYGEEANTQAATAVARSVGPNAPLSLTIAAVT